MMKKLVFFVCASLLFFSCEHEVSNRSQIKNYLEAEMIIDYQSLKSDYQALKNYDYSIPETAEVYNKGLHTDLNDTGSKSYLILMYLAGDSNAIQTNLFANMVSVSKGMWYSQADIKTIALFDGIYETQTGGAESKLFDVRANRNCTSSSLNNYRITNNLPSWISSGEVDTGSYETLSNFISWAEENYNAAGERKTILVIGSHGFGTQGTEVSLSQSNTIFDSTSKSFCPDYTTTSSGTIIHTNEVSLALSNAGFGASNKIDMLIYDVCLCGTIEEAYEVKDYAKALIYSPNSVPGAGFPYEKVIANIRPKSSLFSLGENTVKLFAEQYKNTICVSRPCTITFVDLSFADGIEEDVSALADFFVTNPSYSFIFNNSSYSYLKYKKDIDTSNVNYYCTYFITRKTMKHFYSFDLGYLCDKVQAYAQNIEDSVKQEELETICENIKTHLENMICVSWRGADIYNNSSNSYTVFNSSRNYYGITIVGNSDSSNYNPYAKTEFAFNTDSTWKTLLELLYPEEF